MGNYIIVEKKLGISPDYQYKALRRGWWPKANWHRNKLTALDWTGLFTKNQRVLDLGTGSGNFELEFAKKVSEIVGVDYNIEALEFLRQKLKDGRIENVKLILQDIRNLNKLKKMGRFDAVIMVDVIEHVSKLDGEKVAKQIFDLLTPGGSVVIVTPNYMPLWIALEMLLDKISAVPKLAGEQHLAKYTPQSLRLMFENAGFKTSKLTTLNTFAWLIPDAELCKKVSEWELAQNLGWGNLVMGVFTKPGKQRRRN